MVALKLIAVSLLPFLTLFTALAPDRVLPPNGPNDTVNEPDRGSVLPRSMNRDSAQLPSALLSDSSDDANGLIADKVAPVLHRRRSISSRPTAGSIRHSRARRASDTLSTSVSHLKAVARVATGIYLTQELIKGTDKQEEIISELLRMGSVTPAKINASNATQIETVLNGLKSLPTTLNVQDKMRKVITNAEAGIAIKKNYAGITDITEWPEKSTFESNLNDVKANGVNDAVLRNVTANLGGFTSQFVFAKTDASKSIGLVGYINALVLNLPLLDATVQFSAAGSASDGFSRIRRIVNSLQSFKKIEASDLSDSGVQSTLSTFFEVGKKLVEVEQDMKNVHEVVKTRHFSGSLRQLNYTTGMFQGQDDLSRVHSDLMDKWMRDVIKSNSFEKSVEALRKIESPLRNSDSKFGNIDEQKMDTFNQLISELKKYNRTNSKRAETEVALGGVFNCISGLAQDFSNALNVMNAVENLDALFDTLRANIQKSIQIIKDYDIITRLEKFKTDLVKQENQGKSLNQIFPTGLQDQNQLSMELKNLSNRVSDDLIKTKCATISTDLDKVSTSLSNVVPNAADLKCIADLANLDLVEDFLDLLKSAENTTTSSRIDYQKAITIVNDFKTASTSHGTVLNAIGLIKGDTSVESKRLELLENPKNVSDDIGNAVRGVGEIQKAIEAIPKMKVVADNRGSLVVERMAVQDNLTAAEISLITVLENMDFTTMITELSTFKTAANSKPLANLQNSAAIFDNAKQLNGVQDDLAEILMALDKLMSLSADPQKLISMRYALAELRNIQLDFTKFHQYYEPAKTSMKDLEKFFANYVAAENAINSSTNARKSSKSESKSGNGGLSVVGGSKDEGKSTSWMPGWLGYSLLGLLGCAALVIIVGAVIICCQRIKIKYYQDKERKMFDKNYANLTKDEHEKLNEKHDELKKLEEEQNAAANEQGLADYKRTEARLRREEAASSTPDVPVAPPPPGSQPSQVAAVAPTTPQAAPPDRSASPAPQAAQAAPPNRTASPAPQAAQAAPPNRTASPAPQAARAAPPNRTASPAPQAAQAAPPNRTASPAPQAARAAPPNRTASPAPQAAPPVQTVVVFVPIGERSLQATQEITVRHEKRVFKINIVEREVDSLYSFMIESKRDPTATRHESVKYGIIFDESTRLNYRLVYVFFDGALTLTTQCCDEMVTLQEITPENSRLCRVNTGKLVQETAVLIKGLANPFFHGNRVKLVSKLHVMAFQSPIGSTSDEPAGKEDTCERTWLALIQENTEFIVMLTGFFENKVRVCAEYFPLAAKQEKTFGSIKVKCTSKKDEFKGLVIVRTFEVTQVKNGKKNYMTHYQYIGFPRFGTEIDIAPLIWLLREVENANGTIAVHCENGIGKTGVFTFALTCSRFIDCEENFTNVYGMLYSLRMKRREMITDYRELCLAVHLLIRYMIGDQQLSTDCQKKLKEVDFCYDRMCISNVAPPSMETSVRAKGENLKVVIKAKTDKYKESRSSTNLIPSVTNGSPPVSRRRRGSRPQAKVSKDPPTVSNDEPLVSPGQVIEGEVDCSIRDPSTATAPATTPATTPATAPAVVDDNMRTAEMP